MEWKDFGYGLKVKIVNEKHPWYGEIGNIMTGENDRELGAIVGIRLKSGIGTWAYIEELVRVNKKKQVEQLG